MSGKLRIVSSAFVALAAMMGAGCAHFSGVGGSCDDASCDAACDQAACVPSAESCGFNCHDAACGGAFDRSCSGGECGECGVCSSGHNDCSCRESGGNACGCRVGNGGCRTCGNGCQECRGGGRIGLRGRLAGLIWGRRSNAIPETLPLGSTVRAHYQVMETNAEAADFIFHRHDFVGQTAQLTPDGRDKILEIAVRMKSAPFPVLVERSENNCDPELDLLRRNLVAQILTEYGVPDADCRTIVSPSYGQGLNAIEAEQTYYRHLLRGNGYGNGYGAGLGGYGGLQFGAGGGLLGGGGVGGLGF